MSCPLYKRFKLRGTSFYSFPSASQDINKYNDINFTKFILLNIPKQSGSVLDLSRSGGVDHWFCNNNFYTMDPNPGSTEFGEQLVESLRDYIANYDSSLRESRITPKTDFYNFAEIQTQSEMIFWKWARKVGIIDLEPAIHTVDWDKNLPDFDNTHNSTVSNTDYFREYLWKEREIINYSVSSITTTNAPTKAIVVLPTQSKFKNGDTIVLTGTISGYPGVTTLINYVIDDVILTSNTTTFTINSDGTFPSGVTYTLTNVSVKLVYNRLIQYIGEVQAHSNVQTSRKNITEVTAMVPHHCGQTPTVLFRIIDNYNYYPGLEVPILPQEIQNEILGAENLNSPIRTNPSDYPGSAYGHFDTADKTYQCESGDKYRKRGDYYGLPKLTNNVGLSLSDYYEKLTDFNSDKIDGLTMDFNPNHYIKMNLPDNQIVNFDEFNAASYNNQSPSDFQFNAILWYYEVTDGATTRTNLYGIEFLNNPSSDFDELDPTGQNIETYHKLVSNGYQDGTSYIFDLNLNVEVDNDMLPLSYDPTSVYNMFGFDLYNNILSNTAKVYENFISIISGFTVFQQQMDELKSLVYSQTDINVIKTKIQDLEQLLNLYKTNQIGSSDTVHVSTDFTGAYPIVRMNTIQTEYYDIQTAVTYDIFQNNLSGSNYNINVPYSNKLLVDIKNNDTIGTYSQAAKVVLSSDLNYKQSIDINITPSFARYNKKMNIYIMYDGGTTTGPVETSLISNIDLPIDLNYYSSTNPSATTYEDSYYSNQNIEQYITGITLSSSTYAFLHLNANSPKLFRSGQTVYVDNLYLLSGGTSLDKSGAYQLYSTTLASSYLINLGVGLGSSTLLSIGVVSYYKGMKYNIMRVDPGLTTTVSSRYKITRTLI